jgi:5'-deoxynucleotidase YfbR-like HD superfamily hydrolase
LTSELERLKILEGRISQVVDYINKLVAENDRLKQQMKEIKAEKKTFEEQAKKADKIDLELQKYEEERAAMKGKIELIINKIDELEI